MDSDKLVRLTAIGFEKAGEWRLKNDQIELACSKHENAFNVLYAFVTDETPAYIGKTVQPLCRRMQGYRTPGPTQPTNKRNKTNIIETLKSGRPVFLYVLPDNGLMHYGGFHVNLAAGLEDSIIRQLRPKWNGGAKDVDGQPAPLAAST